MYKEHILKIFRYAMKNIWMLIFPLLRGFSVYHFNAADVKTWLEGAWMDILVLGAILIFGFVLNRTEHIIYEISLILKNNIKIKTMEREKTV